VIAFDLFERVTGSDLVLVDSRKEALEGANVAVISTDHSTYKMSLTELLEVGRDLSLVVDGRHVIEVDSIPEGKAYVGLGRPWIIGRASPRAT